MPARRDNTESPFVTQVREVLAGLNVPVWAGQITHRGIYSLSLSITPPNPVIPTRLLGWSMLSPM